MQWAFFQEIFEAVVMGEVEGARFPEACTCVCGAIDWVVLVDRLSMRSPFTSFSGDHRLICLAFTQALQAAVQKIHTYVASLEEKMDAMEKKKK